MKPGARDQTYQAVVATPDVKPISSKWGYNKKSNPERYKARQVIRRFEQTEYGETYAVPVGKLTIFRYKICGAMQNGLEVDHLDVTAFLYPEVDGDVYMVLTEGLPEHEVNTVFKLKKALYRLKTALRLGHRAFNAFLLYLNSMQIRS